MYRRMKCLLLSQDEAEDKITFDYALKLNATIKIIGFIHLFNKYHNLKELCRHQHINMVDHVRWYSFCKKQAFFTLCCCGRCKHTIHLIRSHA